MQRTPNRAPASGRPVLAALFAVTAVVGTAWAGGTAWTWNLPKGAPEPWLGDLEVTTEKVELGRALFHDKRLSADDSISCATCHDPAHGFAEPKPVSEGVGGAKGRRNAPTVVNATVYETMFWDGRAADLTEQAGGPIANPVEMNLPLDDLVKKLAAIPGYTKRFGAVYGGPVTAEHIADAIAAYEATLVVGDSPLDRYLYAKEEGAISDAAKRGLELYRGKARCQSCHALGDYDAAFTDNLFHNVGVGMNKPEPDLGRFEHTGKVEDKGAFKTSTLRNIAQTAPYMHDGSVATLKEVMELYNRGGEKNPWLSGKIQPLGLTDAEIADLVALLETMTGPLPPHAAPPAKLP